LIHRRKPDVIAIGGFSLTTTKLSQRVKEAVGITTHPVENGLGQTWSDVPSRPPQQDMNIPVIYVHDEVARIYQHSKRAEEEFSALSPTAKYCVGLARYVQSPLNEYAALGPDITAISFDEDSQQLVSSPYHTLYHSSNFCVVSFPKTNCFSLWKGYSLMWSIASEWTLTAQSLMPTINICFLSSLVLVPGKVRFL
jgi:hypothetical protein